MKRLGALLLITACGGDSGVESSSKRSAVLFTLDTTTPGALDPYREEQGVTPNIASLAAEGVVYDAARTVAPLTLPAHASMLTGLYPIRHTVRDNGHVALPGSARTVAESAQRADMDTAAFIAAGVLASPFGLAQGFDEYVSPAAENEEGGFPTRWAGDVTGRALAWLEQRTDRPFFLWVHYFDPHLPYNPPPRFHKKFPGNAYLAEVATMDHHLGRVLEALRARDDYDDLMILVVADHGEAFGKNGEKTHGALVHDATLAVPLIARFPGGARAGSRRGDLVSVVDIAPTLVNHMGLPEFENIDGQDLGGPMSRPGVYVEALQGFLSYGWAPLVGWASEEGLYVHGPTPRIANAAGELVPAAGEAWTERSRLRLSALGRQPVLPRKKTESHLDVDLSSLGYAAGFDVEIPGVLEVPEGLPDPIDRLDESERIFQALTVADIGRLDEGVRQLEAVYEENTRNAFAADQLANLYLRANRPADAVRVMRAILDLGMERPSLRRRLALAHIELEEFDEAKGELGRLLELIPGDAGALELLGTLPE